MAPKLLAAHQNHPGLFTKYGRLAPTPRLSNLTSLEYGMGIGIHWKATQVILLCSKVLEQWPATDQVNPGPPSAVSGHNV